MTEKDLAQSGRRRVRTFSAEGQDLRLFLVAGERVIPEFLQEQCTPDNLAPALAALIDDGPLRSRQLAALARVPSRLALPAGTPSEVASAIVLHFAEHGRDWPRPKLEAM